MHERGEGADRPERRITAMYRSGWSLVDIAACLDRSIKEVMGVIQQNGIPLKPEHVQEAEAHLNREMELELTLRRRTAGSAPARKSPWIRTGDWCDHPPRPGGVGEPN